MRFLLYFTSFASVLVLFASAAGVAVWIVVRSARAAVRYHRERTDPELKAASQSRRAQAQRLDHLRAGQ